MLHAVHDMEPVRALVKTLRERRCTGVNLLCDVSVELRQQVLDRRVKDDAVRESRSEIRLSFPVFVPRETKTASFDPHGPIIDPNDHSDRSQTLDEDNEPAPY